MAMFPLAPLKRILLCRRPKGHFKAPAADRIWLKGMTNQWRECESWREKNISPMRSAICTYRPLVSIPYNFLEHFY
jgi:hypothetical protein